MGSDSRGWIYACMAGHIGIDLGVHLNIDPNPYYQTSHVDAERMALIRKTLFWSSFIAETFWGFYCGRPPLIPNLKHSVSSPSPPAQYTWRPHIDTDKLTEPPPGMRTDLLRFVPSCLAQIAHKMTKIADALYTETPGSVTDFRSFVNSMTKELEQWKASLPPDLFIDTSANGQAEREQVYPPMIIQCNMQYHAAMVLLHRPFVSEVLSPTNMDYRTLGSSQICTQEATAISLLLVIFRRNFSWRYAHLQAVHNATIAGVVHAYDACIFPGERGRRAQDELRVCIQALGEMSLSFKSSTRGIEIIGAVRREWQNRKFLQAGVKRTRGLTAQQRSNT